jgi:hypothetical protein
MAQYTLILHWCISSIVDVFSLEELRQVAVASLSAVNDVRQAIFNCFARIARDVGPPPRRVTEDPERLHFVILCAALGIWMAIGATFMLIWAFVDQLYQGSLPERNTSRFAFSGDWLLVTAVSFCMGIFISWLSPIRDALLCAM